MQTPLVRHGADEKLPGLAHGFCTVYGEMVLCIAREYAGLPDVRTLTARQIRFFYDALRHELKNPPGKR